MARNPKLIKLERQRRLQPRWLGDTSLKYGIEIGARECLGMYSARARGLVSARDGFDGFHKKLYKLMSDSWYEEYFGIDPAWSHSYTEWVKKHQDKINVLKDWDETRFVTLKGGRDKPYHLAMYWTDTEYYLIEIKANRLRRSVSYSSSKLCKHYLVMQQIIWEKEIICSSIVPSVKPSDKPNQEG